MESKKRRMGHRPLWGIPGAPGEEDSPVAGPEAIMKLCACRKGWWLLAGILLFLALTILVQNYTGIPDIELNNSEVANVATLY